MLFENNSATEQQHEDWRLRIKKKFSNTDFSKSDDYLCLINYLDKAPQKFYSQEAFKQYLSFIKSAKLEDPKLIAEILKEADTLLSISNKILTEINEKPIHDILLPEEHNDLINFIDKEVHYNLLKVYETPFFQFSHVVAKYYWKKAKKGIDGLNLYNSVDQIKKVGFSFVDPFYLHDVRNGIAHGKIIFTDLDITYIDNKGNEAKVPTRKIIDTLDGIIDIANGFCLAFKVFCFTNPDFFDTNKIPIPQSILLEELQAKANGPAWIITNCLDSVAMQNKKQLMIYVKNDNWDLTKVQWYCFFTAYWAERFTKNYDRLFFSLHSKNSQFSHSGWAAFDGRRLKELRENNETIIEGYKGVLEGDLIFFNPKFKFPKFIYRIGTFKSILINTLPLAWRKYIDTYFPSPFFVRETQIHSNRFYTVIRDPSVIVKQNSHIDTKQLIRKNKKKIIKLAIKYSRKQCSRFSLRRYLPVKYIRVFIYDTDKRVRRLRNSGLIPELIGTIEVNISKKIPSIDIIGGTPEQHGKYRIVWNRRWRGI